MNKLIQNVFLVAYPFYPIWAWFALSYLHFPIDKIFIFALLPIVFYIIAKFRPRVPAYLIFFILFTIYHLSSVYYNELKPTNTNWFFFFFSDSNVLACVLFFVIENTDFEDDFIKKMSRNMLVIVGVSLVVSVIQTKTPTFFYNVEGDQNEFMTYSDDGRAPSIYSWLGFNSVGVTFPIMIAILLSVYDYRSKAFPFISLSGIIVAFLTRARYVMISTIIAFFQLFLSTMIPLKKKLMVIGFFVFGIFILVGAAQMSGFDIQKVIDDRILEKDTDMGSAKTRILSYNVFMIKFPEHPTFGVGPKTRDDVINLLGGEAIIIHIGYLSYLYYYGLFGASLMIIAILLLLREGWIIGRRDQFWGPFYGLLGFALANFTFVYFVFSEMGIVLAVIYLRYYNLKSERLYD